MDYKAYFKDNVCSIIDVSNLQLMEVVNVASE